MKPILLSLGLLIGLQGYSQKGDPTQLNITKQDTIKSKQYILVLSQDEVAQLFNLIRTSGRYTGAELEVYIQGILARLSAVEPPKKPMK